MRDLDATVWLCTATISRDLIDLIAFLYFSCIILAYENGEQHLQVDSETEIWFSNCFGVMLGHYVARSIASNSDAA